MTKSIFDCLHEGMCWIERFAQSDEFHTEFFDERLGEAAAHRQANVHGCISNLLFDEVKLVIDIQNAVTDECLNHEQVVIFSARVSVATGLGPGAVPKQCVEAWCCISLDRFFVVFEKCDVSSERLSGREVEQGIRMAPIAAVDTHLALTHVSLVLAILNLQFAVICLNDVREEYFVLDQINQRLDGQRDSQHPIALSGARNNCIFARESSLLSIVRKCVREFADDDISQQPRSGVASWNGRTRFFCSDDVLFAFRAGRHFLLVLKPFDRVSQAFQLVSDFIGDEFCLHGAVGAVNELRLDAVRDSFVRQILREDVLFSRGWIGRFFLSGLFRRWCRVTLARIMAFVLATKLTAIAFFILHDENIKLFLKGREQLPSVSMILETV